MELLTTEVIAPLNGKTYVLVEGTGYSERQLLKKGKRLHQVIPDYLASLISSADGEPCKTADVLQLLVPDYEFLLIESYKNCFNSKIRKTHRWMFP